MAGIYHGKMVILSVLMSVMMCRQLQIEFPIVDSFSLVPVPLPSRGNFDKSMFSRRRGALFSLNGNQIGGSYPVKPLEKTHVRLTVVQSGCMNLTGIPPEQINPHEVWNENLERMMELGDKACLEESPDILLFHEFPLTGGLFGHGWDRQAQLNMCIEIPGPITQKLGQLARKHDTYLIFGAYAKDPVHWPGHVLSLQTVLNRNGEIISQIWKPKNIKRFYDTFEITTTTVESVRKKFQDMYGQDAEFPVLRTEFGNLAVSTVQLDPLIYNAFAMKGAEIILRTSTLYFKEDVIGTALVNDVYSAMANMPYEPSPVHGGQSMIVSPRGEVLAQVPSYNEDGYCSADIPIADFRKNRRLPQFSIDLTKDVFQEYEEEIPSNHMDLPESNLPVNGQEMKLLLDEQSQWLNPK